VESNDAGIILERLVDDKSVGRLLLVENSSGKILLSVRSKLITWISGCHL
jgi:hypothetical protein